MVQQAYVEGVSTKRVDEFVRSLGCEGISKSSVSRICTELDAVAESFLARPLPLPLARRARSAGARGGAQTATQDARVEVAVTGTSAALSGSASESTTSVVHCIPSDFLEVTTQKRVGTGIWNPWKT